jgi:hypothetical protein
MTLATLFKKDKASLSVLSVFVSVKDMFLVINTMEVCCQ